MVGWGGSWGFGVWGLGFGKVDGLPSVYGWVTLVKGEDDIMKDDSRQFCLLHEVAPRGSINLLCLQKIKALPYPWPRHCVGILSVSRQVLP